MPNKHWADDPDESETGSGTSLCLSNCQTSDTDITKPDENFGSISTRSLTPQSKGRTRPPQQPHGGSSAQTTTSAGRAYKDPDIDTTERLSDINPDFNRADGTKKLKERVIDRWHRRPKAARIWPGGHFQHDWKYFRIYYQDALGKKMDKAMAKSLRTGRQWLIKENELGTQPRDNVPVYIDDMIKFNEMILQTRKKRFFLGIQRIILCLALMLGLFTAGRKNAILKLQYKHLCISLL
uniref:Pumilio domain-containing protein P35G2.14 n=1 Tax=Talaromyces marneffei PM1 TaxID=1077442 RepID=A0A093ULF6_TALMA